MKKLILPAIVAIGMVSFSATAQETEPMQQDSTEQVTASTETTSVEYKEIDKSQLPQTVKDAVMNDLDGMMVSEAYIGSDNTFKIVVSDADSTETKTLYATENGEWIKPEDKPNN